MEKRKRMIDRWRRNLVAEKDEPRFVSYPNLSSVELG
jgi:hypothetical protein